MMKIFRLLTISITLIMTSACITNIDKPPPDWWTSFEGNGVTEKQIRIALLECGSRLPGDPIEFGYREYLDDYNTLVSTTRCMVNAGFSFNGQALRNCEYELAESARGNVNVTPACKSNAIIPKRRVATRLNSRYCAEYPKSQYCQP